MKNKDYPIFLGEGCGNSFVLLDLLPNPQLFDEDFKKQAHELLLAHQRDDALILLPHKEVGNHLYVQMVVLEPDGSVAAFCGNGARVVAAYLKKYYSDRYKEFSLVSHNGNHKLFFYENNVYGVDMLQTIFDPHVSKFVKNASDLFVEKDGIFSTEFSLSNKRAATFYFTETTEPHLVSFDELSHEDLVVLGQKLNTKHRTHFPSGININVAQEKSQDSIGVTTYERGVNRITQACGTGATSCAMLHMHLKKIHQSKMRTILPGGSLFIDAQMQKHSVVMIGPATISQFN